jgi:hypothetical protein
VAPDAIPTLLEQIDELLAPLVKREELLAGLTAC